MPAAAKVILALGAAFAAAAVLLGAFGAHALKSKLAAEALAVYQTAVQYHFWHALGLLAVGLAALHLAGRPWLVAAACLLAAGIVLFSGSLYLLALSGQRWFGAVAPFGGAAFILGWIAFAIGALRG
ncbi:MAG: DUF423 domain-containing protein [Betaproteobacteria bacterium]|nr:DUF423 domain-containing protein [Betaproteobacteria bacterium]